jgi:hypothetical protein
MLISGANIQAGSSTDTPCYAWLFFPPAPESKAVRQQAKEDRGAVVAGQVEI